jgi:His/Glu/Gln/Arg/opine family amino acid ABC transporter permease subunit
MAYNWNWDVFLQPTATGGDETYLGWMFYGFKMTITLSLSAWVIALAFGAVVGVLRTVPNRWLSGFATAYVEVFRNIPLLVQLFLWYFVHPRTAARSSRQRFQADQPDPAAVSRFDGLSRPVYQRARRRTGALGDQLVARPDRKTPGWRWASRSPRPTAT